MAGDPALAANPLSHQHIRPTSGEGGALGRTGFAWAVFEWARNPYYVLVVIYIFAPYFARDIIGADLLASGALDAMEPEAALAAANAQGQATIASRYWSFSSARSRSARRCYGSPCRAVRACRCR